MTAAPCHGCAEVAAEAREQGAVLTCAECGRVHTPDGSPPSDADVAASEAFVAFYAALAAREQAEAALGAALAAVLAAAVKPCADCRAVGGHSCGLCRPPHLTFAVVAASRALDAAEAAVQRLRP